MAAGLAEQCTAHALHARDAASRRTRWRPPATTGTAWREVQVQVLAWRGRREEVAAAVVMVLWRAGLVPVNKRYIYR